MRRRRGGGGAAGRAAAGETERQAVSGSSFRSVVFCCECQFVSAAAAKMKGEGPKEKGEVEEEECEESSKRGKKKKKRRRGNRLAEKTATTAPERDERPLFLSPFIRLRFMPPPLLAKSRVSSCPGHRNWDAPAPRRRVCCWAKRQKQQQQSSPRMREERSCFRRLRARTTMPSSTRRALRRLREKGGVETRGDSL